MFTKRSREEYQAHGWCNGKYWDPGGEWNQTSNLMVKPGRFRVAITGVPTTPPGGGKIKGIRWIGFSIWVVSERWNLLVYGVTSYDDGDTM